jgi:hypothetical protein
LFFFAFVLSGLVAELSSESGSEEGEAVRPVDLSVAIPAIRILSDAELAARKDVVYTEEGKEGLAIGWFGMFWCLIVLDSILIVLVFDLIILDLDFDYFGFGLFWIWIVLDLDFDCFV